ncbi:23S ribosomal RNA methyltransferase Erm [Streptomyces sp. NPDC059816]|uniref:23S ribosomal RNA methyltransferase Erm n=1 Tax=Streptomyces sp. NPDC059816 TaxID=3346960 RepID=UPI00364DFC0F
MPRHHQPSSRRTARFPHGEAVPAATQFDAPPGGRHELGQNFLVDRAVIRAVVDLVARTEGPIVEIGTGDGALTLPLQELRRPLTGVEIDPRRVAGLRRRTGPDTTLVRADFLRYRPPAAPHVLVGNLPFHATTAMLRRVLAAPHWTDAVLLVQWEVARRRAGVGGATMMTAEWWPWYAFRLARRVPAAAFRPRPGVDGGLLTITRRPRPLLPVDERTAYRDFVRRTFTGRGRGVEQIVTTVRPTTSRRAVRDWARRNGVPGGALPKDLTDRQWVELYLLDGGRGVR